MGPTPAHFWRYKGIWGQRIAVLCGESGIKSSQQTAVARLNERATHPRGGHHADVTTVNTRICAAEMGNAAVVHLNLQLSHFLTP